jgi:acyl transferase domain-containing protein/acyl carrier protein
MDELRLKREYTGLEIAVIAMSCRFPDANNIEEFWENLRNGVESIHFFNMKEAEISDPQRVYIDDPDYVPAKGMLENPGYFDAGFFGYKPLEADVMDPQIRFFYECCWEGLELSGYNPESYEGLIGVYAGATNHRAWEMAGLLNQRAQVLGYFARDHLIDRDFLSTRIAYKLNLRGPAITLKTACSTGLVAVDLACRALLTGQCDIALAGATSMLPETLKGYVYREGMIASPDGHVRSFDHKSEGVVFSDGTGVVVLKRLKAALKDRDIIQAVIKGTAVNNDGSRKGAYEAPGTEGQEEVIRAAIHMARVEPESITYLETHGTGTVIGDPIEIEALKRAFNTNKKGFCAVGSVKSNFGHLDTAAGIAGFIKTVLVIMHRMIPPSLHFVKPNPKIDFENTPFYVNTGLVEWKNEKYPLRAGVSSFGVGGTNAHAVLEEPPEPGETSPGREWQMILASARTTSALNKVSENLLDHFKKNPGAPTADAAYTLQVGRKVFKYRQMWMAHAVKPALDMPFISEARDKNRLIFMFSGQGAQYVNMGWDVYRTERVFREEMDRCFEILKGFMDYNVKEILYPGDSVSKVSEVSKASEVSKLSEAIETIDQSSPDNNTSHTSHTSHISHMSYMSYINQTEITQPVIFAFEYAMAKLLMHWGIKPYAMIGHSIGEYVAACLSGVFSPEGALRLVTIRGKLMQQMPSGAMLSVTLPEEELMPLLRARIELSLAAVNAPSLCVVSGPHQTVAAFENQLKQKGIQCQRLHTSHAFHSQMMDPILTQFEQAVKEISLNKPQLPYISNVSGQWITLEEALSPGYWARQIRSPVRFRDGLSQLLNDPDSIFIELGPGRSLATFAQKHNDKKDEHLIINLVKHPKEDKPDDYFLLSKIGQLWLHGVNIDWQGFYSDEKRRRVVLPTYPFERQHYWLERPSQSINVAKTSKEQQINKLPKKSDMEAWFYVPSWKRTPLPPARELGQPLNWLIFTDQPDTGIDSIGSQLVERLKQDHPGDRFSRVEIGASYGFTPSDNHDLIFTVNPGQENDYQALITELKKQGQIPHRVIHLWNVTGRNTGEPGVGWAETYEMYEYSGFYSLIYLVKAIGKEGIGEEIRIIVVTDNMQEISREETLCPLKAMVLGPARIIPVEYPNLHCCSIDVILPAAGSHEETILLNQLAVEFTADSPDTVIAYRNHYRWVQSFEPAPLASPVPASPPGTGEVKALAPPSNLKDSGVYLITGGLGGIGLELARHLAKSVKARLILTSRSPFPKPGEWQDWLNTHSRQDKISTRIRKILELEAAGTGTEIMVVSADVSDYQQMQTAIAEIEERWGKINGVIHAAGLPGGGMVQLKTPEIAGKVLAPKVQGTLVLNKILKDHPLDFFILFSSINSVVPMFGQADYFSANAFLDSFAHYKNSMDKLSTVSINWDTWLEVGMAVEAAKQWGDRGRTRAIHHPLFDQWLYDDQEQAIFVTYFNLNRHWVLNEHKIAESGKGLAPGVTYLEMARQALETYTGSSIDNNNGLVEISDVYFLNPLIIEEGEERETQFILKKQPDNKDSIYDFLVQSRGNTGKANWQKHAVGKIRWIEKGDEPSPHDISKITGEWVNIDVDISQSSPKEQKPGARGGLLVFGPRWRSTRRAQLGEKQGLALLELGNEFNDELEFYKLHPALLDTSTGLLFGHVGKAAYIPFAYKRLIMRAPLSARIYSHCRVVESGDTVQKESLKFDVTIMDEQGKELVDIKEFTMLQVSEEVKDKVKEKESASLSSDLAWKDKKQEPDKLLKNGILPSEGMEAFNRILSGASGKFGPLPQVIVSTTDLLTRIEHSGFSPFALQKGGAVSDQTPAPGTGKEPAARHARPAISSVYVAPQTETEKKIAAIWQNLLGIEQVGINDDFFELGGDSLNVVQVNNELQKAFNKDIPVAVMFMHQTIRTFTQYLQQEESGDNVLPPGEDRSDEIAKSKDRLRVIMKRK